MTLFLIILLSVLVLLTVIPLTNRKKWWVRMLDFPRLQIVFLFILSLTVCVFILKQFTLIDYFIIGLSVLALGTQLYYIFPYFIFSKKEVEKSSKNDTCEQFSVMVCNVRMKNKTTDKLVKLIQDVKPSLLLVVESNKRWENALSPLEKRFKHCIKHPLDNTYGMHLYSNIELIKSKIEFLIEDDVPSIHATLKLKTSQCELTCIHPRPPAPSEAETSKSRDKELLKVAKQVKKSSLPSIVLGDLNDVAWSDTSKDFQQISKLLDPRKGRGFFNTYHANIPLFRWALDHVFFSKEFKLVKIKRLKNVGSDHFPIYVELGI